MSMEDWDFGYYGKGLDGYVHFRQGIKEIESHAPYSKCRHARDDSLDDLDDLDEYDDPEDDLFYEPPQKTPVSSAKPQKPSVVQKEEKRNDTWYATVGGSIVVFAILAVLMCGAGIVTVEDISDVVVTAIPVLGAAEIIQRIVWAYMNK